MASSYGRELGANNCGVKSTVPSKRYTLVAVAPSAGDLIAMAGGLLCDRALAGWTVTAVVGEHAEEQALTILGVGIHCAAVDSRVAADAITAQTVVVSAQWLESKGSDFPGPLASFSFPEAEVLLYGDKYQLQASRRDLVEYRLSSASRVFKAHAQRVVGHPEPRDDCVETFVRAPLARGFGSTGGDLESRLTGRDTT